jgi:hypothetical protein
MWGRKKSADVVAASIIETQEARGMIDECNELLARLERELTDVLSHNAMANMAETYQTLNSSRWR